MLEYGGTDGKSQPLPGPKRLANRSNCHRRGQMRYDLSFLAIYPPHTRHSQSLQHPATAPTRYRFGVRV